MATYGGKTDGAIQVSIERDTSYHFDIDSKTKKVKVYARRLEEVGASNLVLGDIQGYEDKNIGTYNPETGKIDFTDEVKANERSFFSKDKNIKTHIKDPAKLVLTKGLVQDGSFTEEGAKTEASKAIDGEKLTAIDPDAKAINDGLSTFIKSIEAEARTKYEALYYPESIRQSKQDRIIFTLKKLVKVTYSADFDAEPFKREYGVSDLEGSVTLPIQSGITDSNQVKWGPDELDEIKARAAASSLTLAKSRTGEELIGNLGNILTDAQKKIFDKSTPEFRQAIAVALAGEAVGAQGLLSRATGTVLNPNLELLFQGPQLRPFTFQFRLSPRGIEEAKMVKKIIRFFKQAMSVKTTKTNVFLSTPHVFDIKYQTIKGDELVDHTSLNKIKTCALLGCDVDYTPDGTYSTFNDPEKTMTSYNLTLRFNELEPIFDKDYTELDDDKLDSTMIGF